MSVQLAVHGTIYPKESAGPIWRIGIQGNKDANLNEGDSMAFILQLLNPQAGAQIVWAMTNASGSVIGDNNWVVGLSVQVTKILTAAGLTVQFLTLTSTPKRVFTLDMLITMPAGSKYAGQLLTIPLTAKQNHANDIDPRSSQCVLVRKVNSTDPDSIAGFGGNLVTIHDTSKTPTGTPTVRANIVALDGVSAAKVNYAPGDGFQLQIVTANIIPGTKLKVIASNTTNNAQTLFNPSFRQAMLKAITPPNAPPGITFEQTTYPPPAGQAWYNGYTIVFGSDYAGDVIKWNMIYSWAAADGTATQLDIIASIAAEGTVSDFTTTQQKGNWDSTVAYSYGDIVTYAANGLQYVALQGGVANLQPDTQTNYWRPYQATQVLSKGGTTFSQLPPPRYWEIRATTDGTTIFYALQVPVGTTGDVVAFVTTNAPAGFAAALSAAASAANSPVAFDGTHFSPTAASSYVNCSLTWSIPFAGSGKHQLALTNQTGSPITIGDACVYLSPFTPIAEPKFVTGVNNSGGEFGTVPGVYGTDYRYPSTPESAVLPHKEMDYLWAMGVRVMRFPVRWSRIQLDGQFTPLSGEKDPATPWTSGLRADIARVDEALAYWTGLGGIFLLDLHNYGARGSDGPVGYDQPVKVPALLDVWQRLALRYQSNPRVWFGLMNEPGWSAPRCRENNQWLVNMIRSTTDAKNKILVAGTQSSSANGWVADGQAAAYADFYDPAGNLAFEPHCYFDSDGSGTTGVCVSGSQSRLAAITAWARPLGFKLFLGEVAGGDPTIASQATCQTVTTAAYQYMTANKDVWLGWTSWGFGPRWPNTYMFLLNPGDYTVTTSPSPCMQMLSPYLTETF
uniref:glycoside hydrolase family 5 protein n=1 Tax=uncultured Sphingomonas sp. TaxID=158754 RepID=UPI0035CAE0B2